MFKKKKYFTYARNNSRNRKSPKNNGHNLDAVP